MTVETEELYSAKTGKLLLQEEDLAVSNGVQATVNYKVMMIFLLLFYFSSHS